MPMNPHFQSSGVIQLALALVFDLGLNRPVIEDEEGPGAILENAKKRALTNVEPVIREIKRTMDERRTLLGVFYLSSLLVLLLLFNPTSD
jgi:hypothetical protein